MNIEAALKAKQDRARRVAKWKRDIEDGRFSRYMADEQEQLDACAEALEAYTLDEIALFVLMQCGRKR